MACGHQVDLTGRDPLIGAKAVAVVQLALQQIGHRREADMRVGAHIDPLPGQKFRRTHLIEKDEGPDHPARMEGQDAPDLEPTQVLAACVDHQFDHVSAPKAARAA